MKISVIVPAYNAEKWVAQCLSILLRQTHKELEIIVIDDGSTDSTAEIAQKYVTEGNSAPATADNGVLATAGSDGTITVRLLRQPNSGLSLTRNRGLDEATGDYIHFMDVDDLVNIDFYARMAEAAAITDADMACCGMIDETRPYRSHTHTERWLLQAADDKFNHTKVFEWGYVWRYLFRRSFLLQHGLRFDPERIIEDMPFAVEAVWEAESIVTVPGAVYLYKRRAGSILTTRNRDFARRRSADWKVVQQWRDAFMDGRGLGHVKPRPQAQVLYSLFGVPLVTRYTADLGRRTSWRMLGLKVWESKSVRQR